MEFDQNHISDEDLMLAIDGELPEGEAAQCAAHLEDCWSCRARRQEIESAMATFMKVHERHLRPELPSANGPRALLKARLGQMPSPRRAHRLSAPLWAQGRGGDCDRCAGHCAGRPLGFRAPRCRDRPRTFDSEFLPDSGRGDSRQPQLQVCSAPSPNNRAVPASLERQVFAEYGISGAQARSYEVDYLITPALGGADDIHNLWPQSYAETVWNARVKDALEDRLHNLVCQGQVDLATAQRDISMDWIAAYKKYFQTDQPLAAARP